MMPLTNDGELMVVWEKCLLYCSRALPFFFLMLLPPSSFLLSKAH